MRNIVFILSLLVFVACAKEEFDPKLDSYNKNLLVIEGLITTSPDIQRMQITRTSSYMDGLEIKGVENATVTIICDNSSYAFTHSDKGIYLPPAGFIAEVGKTYKLNVTVDGLSYEAESTVSEPLALDSLSSERDEFEDDCFRVKGWFVDNAAKDEHFLFKYAVNDVMVDTLTKWSIYSDMLTNNVRFENVDLFYGVDANENDKVTVYTFSISKKYYNFIKDAQKNLEEPIPFNPSPGIKINGNISNGALGFFQASAIMQTSTKLKKY